MRSESAEERKRGGAEAPGIRRVLLAFLSVLTAVPVLWLGHGHATRVAESDRRRHDESLVALAQSVAGQLGTMLESRCRDLEVLAGNLEVLGELSGPRVEALLGRHWERSGYYSGMYVANAEGTALVRARSRQAEPGAGTSYRDRDYYRSLVETRRTVISSVQRGKYLDSVNIQIASPVFGPGGDLVGYAEGSLELDTFSALVRRYASRVPGSRVVVLDTSSRVVADSASTKNAGTDQLSSAPLFQRAAPRSTLASANDERGVPMRAALEPGGPTLSGWRVVAAEPQASIDENARRLRNETWAAAVVVWLLVFGVAGAVASRFTRELGQVNERLTLLVNALEHADDGIEITGPDARFIYVNPAFERITGYRMSEVLGKKPVILRTGSYDPNLYEEIWRRINAGQVYTGTFAGRRKDGTFFDQELKVWPIHGDAGEITHFVGLRRDVTDRRRTEQALRVSERMASVGTLAAGVAHEINNPLTYVLLNLRFLRDHVEELGREAEAGRERARLALDRALEGSERVSAIVKDLRMLSRPNDRSVKVLDLEALLESALRMVGSDIRHHARLTQELRPVPPVLGNEAQLGQVFLNLLVNALQALGGRPVAECEIGVRTWTDEEGRAVVEIRDTGSGISPEHLQQIFDPFFTTKPVGLGTGIGLSVCHGTVKAMNGEIRVESTVGKGSAFRVILPPAPSNAEELPADEAATGSERRPIVPRRVLVMDDDHAVAEALRQALSGHEITVVSSAEAGLDAVRASRFDTMLCDIMMPGMTGIDFYERLEPEERQKVVFITGGVLTDAARRFLAEQKAPCLEKPVGVEELEEALARIGKDPELSHGVGPAA